MGNIVFLQYMGLYTKVYVNYNSIIDRSCINMILITKRRQMENFCSLLEIVVCDGKLGGGRG